MIRRPCEAAEGQAVARPVEISGNSWKCHSRSWRRGKVGFIPRQAAQGRLQFERGREYAGTYGDWRRTAYGNGLSRGEPVAVRQVQAAQDHEGHDHG